MSPPSCEPAPNIRLGSGQRMKKTLLSEPGGIFPGIGKFIRSGEFIRRTK